MFVNALYSMYVQLHSLGTVVGPTPDRLSYYFTLRSKI